MRKLEDLEIFLLAMDIGERVWIEVHKWDYFSKNSVGLQWVKCSDSIAANIAEGYGRQSNREAIQFCYYSRGSIKEATCFLEKSHNRKLVSDEFYTHASIQLELLGKKLNSYIGYIKKAN